MTSGGRQQYDDGGTSPVMLITVEEFAQLVRLSRRQVDRLRSARPPGFPKEYEMGSGVSRHGHCPRFKLADVLAWIETRALW